MKIAILEKNAFLNTLRCCVAGKFIGKSSVKHLEELNLQSLVFTIHFPLITHTQNASLKHSYFGVPHVSQRYARNPLMISSLIHK